MNGLFELCWINVGSLFYQTNFICHFLDPLHCGRKHSHSHCYGVIGDWVHVLQFIMLHLICKEVIEVVLLAYRHMSHLTNMLLIVHQSFAGETEDTS